MKYVVRYTATYETTVEVEPGETLEDVVCDIDIPENATSAYVSGSFDMVRNDDNEIIIYEEK